MKYLKIVFLIIVMGMWGCANDPGNQVTTSTPSSLLPNSYGRPNQIFVIADSTLWKGAVGDTFFYYFAAPYLLLPQPEPIFDIQYMTPEELIKHPAKKRIQEHSFFSGYERQRVHDQPASPP